MWFQENNNKKQRKLQQHLNRNQKQRRFINLSCHNSMHTTYGIAII